MFLRNFVAAVLVLQQVPVKVNETKREVDEHDRTSHSRGLRKKTNSDFGECFGQLF